MGRKKKVEYNDKMSDKTKFEIIEYIRQKPIFYDPKHPDYKKSKQTKIDDLNQFGQTLTPPMSGEVIYSKWYQLRGQYSSYQTLYNKSPSGSAGQKKIWKFFSSLSWLDDYIEYCEEARPVKHPHLSSNQQQSSHIPNGQSTDDPLSMCCGTMTLGSPGSFDQIYYFDQDDDTESEINLVNNQKATGTQTKKLKIDSRPKSNKGDAINSLFTPVSNICSSNCQTKSANQIYCDGLALKLNLIYDSIKHDGDYRRYFALEDLKAEIDRSANETIRTLNQQAP